MSRCPLLRSRLAAALAKRTLLASSSAFRRSSTVRSGARLSISALVYHRRLRPVIRSYTCTPPRDREKRHPVSPSILRAPPAPPRPPRSHQGPLLRGGDS